MDQYIINGDKICFTNAIKKSMIHQIPYVICNLLRQDELAGEVEHGEEEPVVDAWGPIWTSQSNEGGTNNSCIHFREGTHMYRDKD